MTTKSLLRLVKSPVTSLRMHSVTYFTHEILLQSQSSPMQLSAWRLDNSWGSPKARGSGSAFILTPKLFLVSRLTLNSHYKSTISNLALNIRRNKFLRFKILYKLTFLVHVSHNFKDNRNNSSIITQPHY